MEVGGTKQFVYGVGYKLVANDTALAKAFVDLPGGGQAVYTSAGLAYYRHPDHIGSSRFASTPARTCYADVSYAPFGENYNSTCGTDLSFAGFDQDSGFPNLYDATFRKYHPVQGRWISPDPAGLGAVDPSNPQSWNRYAYVTNDPLSLIDPLGLAICGESLDCEAVVHQYGASFGGYGGALGGTLVWAFSSAGEYNTGGYVNLSLAGVPGPPRSQPAANNVNKMYRKATNCNTSAVGLMQQVESNFSQFGNYTGNFGPVGLTLVTADVTFGNGSATPVTQGGTISISDINRGPDDLPMGTFNVSVTVTSVSSTSFSFATNPGHVLYPATISFSASDAGPGQINFLVQVNGDFAGPLQRLGYYMGGYNLENNIWRHFEQNVQAVCTGQPTGPG